jgi:hypothetical protein
MKKINRTDSLLNDGTLRVEEYEFRPIDKNGDVIDPQFCDDMIEAMKWTIDAVGAWDGECVAWVIEKHLSYHPACHAPRGQNPDNYTTLAHGGDEAALREGGWLA